MFTEAYTRRKFEITLIMTGIGISAGVIYAVLSDGLTAWMPLTNAVIGGGLLGMYTALIELQLFSAQFRRKIRFIPLLLFRMFIYSVMTSIVLFLVFSISRVFWFDLSYTEVLKSEEFSRYLYEKDFLIVLLYSIGVIVVVIFTYQISRKIGQVFLINMITGKYYNPKKTKKIFLFIKLASAETISRKLGLLNYYRFVNDVIYDITPLFLTYHAHIYHYVDNEIVVYWYPKKGIKEASCIRTYYAICDKLYERREYYFRNYQVYPAVQAAMHIGDVVQGEIGHGKTEIDFYGDVLNTTSRMLSKTSREVPLLLSGELLEKLVLPEIYREELIGDIFLEGKSRNLAVYRLLERPVKHAP